MVTEQVQNARRQALPRSLADPSQPDRHAQVIAIARAWDVAPGDRRDLPPPWGGGARCFAVTAARGSCGGPNSSWPTNGTGRHGTRAAIDAMLEEVRK